MKYRIPRSIIVRCLSVLLLSSLAVHAGEDLVIGQHSSVGYRPQGFCQVTCEFAYPSDRTLFGLAWLVTLPQGWQITSVSGNGTPEVQGSDIVFLGSVTNRPIRFNYTMSVPAGEIGVRSLSSSVEYTLNDMTNQATAKASPDPLLLSQQLQLLVSSSHGAAIPPTGTNIYSLATNLVLAVTNSPVTVGETRFVCTGWTGTGSIVSGSGTNTEQSITNDSEISWLWKTQNALTLSNTVGGSITDLSGWYDSGSNVSVTASAATHYQFSGWIGDTNSCTLTGDQITIPMDRSRHITARFLLDSHSLQVNSLYGNPQPPVGSERYEYGTTVPCAVTISPATYGDTQYVCIGWTGTGSVNSGTGTNTEVTVTTDSTLSWLWKTQFVFTATHTVGGTVSDANGWYDLGASVQVTATSISHYHFTGWAGQTNGCQIEGDKITVPIDSAKSVQACFTLDNHKLIVSSEHGGATPPEGTNSNPYGETVPCTVTNSPLVDGNYRYVCTGWSGSGSIPDGSGTNVQIVLTNDSTISWLWKTQSWLSVTSVVGGSVADVSGWYDTMSNVAVTASAASHFHFVEWQGTTNSCTIEGDRISVPMNEPRFITAVFALDTHSLAVSSPFGDTEPAKGTNYFDYETSIPCAVNNSPVQDDVTRFVCTGWTGWGSVSSGNGTNIQITLTNDSGIAWLWQTQFWMTATANTGGTLSLTNGWYDQGDSPVVTATATPHYHFGGWSGQTNGCLISSNQITLVMDMPRDITAIFDIDQHNLTVNSKFGTAIPPVGTNALNFGTNLVCSIIDSPVVNLTTQFVCSGWTGSGSIPSSGTKSNTALITLTNNSTITWKWTTNVWLNLAANLGGSIKSNAQSAWYLAGSTVSNVEATASNNYHFTTWSGDTNGLVVTSNKISVLMNRARSLTANFAKDEYRIVVASKFGSPVPPVGTNLFGFGSNTFCALPNSPVMNTLTQFVCTGWSGSGSVPSNGSSTNTAWFTVTNHSTITWKWGTNFWLGVSNTEGGSVDRTSAWFTAGVSVSNVTATPSNHYHFGSWTGDTSGSSINSNRISFTMTRPRQFGASFILDAHQLIVSTPFGTASPTIGTNLFGYGTVLSSFIQDSPVTVGRTRYVCTGWWGAGSVANNGSGTNTGPFSLDMDSSVNWMWKTQYLFNVSCDAGGLWQAQTGWQDSGNVVTASVSATHGFTFDKWTGDVPNGMESENPIVLTMDQARSINASIRVDTNLIRATHAASGYRSPEVGRVVSCSFECPPDRSLLSLAWLVTLPDGWQITSVTGHGSPEIQGNEIVFLGSLLTNQVNFSYTMTIPGNAATTNAISTIADFQLDGMANSVGLPANPTPLCLSRFHSADYATNYWTINGSEMSRFLSYWRAGGFQANAGGFDGFMAGAGNTNSGYHSADYLAPRWVISGTELNRVLAYWRGGGYHVDSAGNDGYVAGPIVQGLGMSIKGTQSLSANHDGPLFFDPGNSITISNTFAFSGTLLSLLCRPQLPRGWVITEITGDGSPEYSLGEIVWTTSLPSSPIHLVYTVKIPASEYCERKISSDVEYQISGMANEASTTALPSLLALSVQDQDNDGLPDTWENQYGVNSTNLVPDADDDKDGMLNWQECVAGTNPNLSNSVFNLTGNMRGGDDQYIVSWASVSNRWYKLERSFNLLDGFSPLASNLPSMCPMNCYTDTVTSVTSLFYKVEVEP